MTIGEFRDEVIRLAVESVEKTEDRDYRKRGCLYGLELCRGLLLPDDYARLIAERREVQSRLRREDADLEQYWEYVCATAQLEFLYERMKVAFRVPGPWSCNAAIQYAQIVGVAADDV